MVEEELVPDPDNTLQVFEIRRNWIASNNYFPTAHTNVDCDTLIWKLNQKEVYQMILDTYLAPNLTNTRPVLHYVTQMAWSPAGMLYHGRCLLASVTNYGCVLVQAPEHWGTVVNISSLWIEHCSPDLDSCDSSSAKEQYDILHTRVGKLKATSITWTTLINTDGKCYCLFVMSLLNGTLLFWRLNAPSSPFDKSIDPTLVMQHDTGQYHITSMHWRALDENSGILCVGDIKGLVKMHSFKWENGEIHHVASRDLWPHNDRIQVSKLLSIYSKDYGVTVVAIKGSFVVAIALDAEGAVIGTKPHLIRNLSITGAVFLDVEKLLLVTHNGSIYHLVISRINNEVEIEDLALKNIVIPKSAYYGLASSANGAIFCLITSFNVMFDHLIQREPAQLTFFKLSGFKDPYEILQSNPSRTLTKAWDCMELIRLQGPPFAYVNEGNEEELNDYELKIRMWLCRFAVAQEDIEDDEETRSAMREHLRCTEQLVLRNHVCKYASQLLSNKMLTADDLQSLYLMLSWLRQVQLDGSSDSVDAIISRAAQIQGLPNQELCVICQEECLEIETPSESRCVAGHILSRCCVTLLQCAEVPFWACRICHSVACYNEGKTEAPLCVYCDSLMQLNEGLFLREGEEDEEEEEDEEKGEEEETIPAAQESKQMETEEKKQNIKQEMIEDTDIAVQA